MRAPMRRALRPVVWLPLWLLLWLPPAGVPAAAGTAVDGFPPGLGRGLDLLLRLVDRATPVPGDSAELAGLLDFVAAGPTAVDLPEGGPLTAAAAYHRFDLRSSLRDVIRLGFSPDIPSHILMPSSVRRARWVSVEGRAQHPLPRLWPLLEGLDRPVTVRAVEAIENTPDLNTGAYYAYDLERALVLCRRGGRRFFISVSVQRDVSAVGREGVVVGPDDDWNYLYLGTVGLNRPGLGWVRSYMYAGWSVSVYAERDGAEAPGVRCGVFRSLKAGWASVNMVRRNHIQSGLERYARTFRRIIEHPEMPAGDLLAAGFRRLGRLSPSALAARLKVYFSALAEARGASLNEDNRRHLERLGKGNPAAHMDRDSMEALLAVEHLKAVLGMRPAATVDAVREPHGERTDEPEGAGRGAGDRECGGGFRSGPSLPGRMRLCEGPTTQGQGHDESGGPDRRALRLRAPARHEKP